MRCLCISDIKFNLILLFLFILITEEKPTVQTGKLYKPAKLVEVTKKQPEERQETLKEKNERLVSQQLI